MRRMRWDRGLQAARGPRVGHATSPLNRCGPLSCCTAGWPPRWPYLWSSQSCRPAACSTRLVNRAVRSQWNSSGRSGILGSSAGMPSTALGASSFAAYLLSGVREFLSSCAYRWVREPEREQNQRNSLRAALLWETQDIFPRSVHPYLQTNCITWW